MTAIVNSAAVPAIAANHEPSAAVALFLTVLGWWLNGLARPPIATIFGQYRRSPRACGRSNAHWFLRPDRHVAAILAVDHGVRGRAGHVEVNFAFRFAAGGRVAG